MVLFLCTGNYYRSRFAEILFNSLAARHQLPWRAVSRGLKIGWPGNVGPLSPHTRQRLDQLGIDGATMNNMPAELGADDLESAERIIALKEDEHRAMLAKSFPAWENRVTYWHVHDLDGATPTEALKEIEQLVDDLVEKLKSENDGPV
jgi:protein-tyrosine phosphatase